MKKEIIRLLEAADDPENCKYPQDFNRYALLDSVTDLKYNLEKIVGRPFELEDRIFDSSYFAELDIKEPAPTKVFDLAVVN